MTFLLWTGAAVAAFAVAAIIATYLYGRFARTARGTPSSALPPGDGETLLDRNVAALVAGGSAANGLLLLSSSLDAFAARALSGMAAGRSLDLMYYIWHNDLCGRLLARTMLDAADRGVRVRLLLDDINTHKGDPVFLAIDSHPNIEIRLFNPTRSRSGFFRRGIEMALRAFSVTRRMHNKAWIADGRIAIVGGRNIGDEYFDAAKATNFRDLDVLTIGPVVAQCAAMFDAYWNSDAVVPVIKLATGNGTRLETVRQQLEAVAGGPDAAPFLARVRERVSAAAMLDTMTLHWTDVADVVADPPDKALDRGHDNWLMRQLYPLLSAARVRVQLTSPYFVPGDDGATRLTGVVARGVEVAVLTNSLAATDVAAVHGGYASYRRQLVAGGVRLHELQPASGRADLSLIGSRRASLHTKAFTVDGRLGFVGSFNFDPRSESLNTEMGVVFEQPQVVAEMDALFADETRPEMSYAVTLDEGGRLGWQGIEDGKPVHYRRDPHAGALRRLIAWIVGLLPLQSQL